MGVWDRVKYVVMPLPVIVAFKDCIGSMGRIDGNSMQPSLNPEGATSRDRVLLNKLAARCNYYQRGDVCMLRNPVDPNEWIVKRLIATEGDRVRTRNSGTVLVPQGFGWLEGDNESSSKDSNTYGPMPLALIEARVSYIIWPPSRVGAVERKVPSDRVFQGYGRSM